MSVPFAALPRYVEQLRRGESLERPTERLKEERGRIIADYRELLRSEDERQAFDQMLGLCHLVFPFVENHKFYCEHWFTTLFFKKVREFGALLVANGVLSRSGRCVSPSIRGNRKRAWRTLAWLGRAVENRWAPLTGGRLWRSVSVSSKN